MANETIQGWLGTLLDIATAIDQRRAGDAEALGEILLKEIRQEISKVG